MIFLNHRKQREFERMRYQETQRNQTRMPGMDDNAISSTPGKRKRKGPTPKWHYIVPSIVVPFAAWLGFVWLMQYIAMYGNNFTARTHHKPATFTIFQNYHLGMFYFLAIFAAIILGAYIHKKAKATWFNNNAMYLTDDLPEHDDDAYIRTMDNLTQELNVVPDVGLGYNGHASSLMSHAMISNKGIKKIEIAQYDANVDGKIKRDENGNIVKKKMPMFDPELADLLFSMTGVPQAYRKLYDATEYDFNRKLSRKEGGGKDKNGHYKRAGAFGRAEYDKLSDFINNEFYPLDTDTERPAGVYFVDSRPVNTILIAITRAGKGGVNRIVMRFIQRYIKLVYLKIGPAC